MEVAPKQTLAPVLKEALKCNPLKDNAMICQAKCRTTPLSQQKQSFAPSSGSSDGEPAMNGKNAQGDSSSELVKTSQSPIYLKAYAIAELLQFQYWDNSKVSFIKQPATF